MKVNLISRFINSLNSILIVRSSNSICYTLITIIKLDSSVPFQSILNTTQPLPTRKSMRTKILKLLILVGNRLGSTEEFTDPGRAGFQIHPGTKSSRSLGEDMSIIILRAPFGFGRVVVLLMVNSLPKTPCSSSKVQGPAAMP